MSRCFDQGCVPHLVFRMDGITASRAVAETAVLDDSRQADELATLLMEEVMKRDASSPEMRLEQHGAKFRQHVRWGERPQAGTAGFWEILGN
jgi:hypothetical protein